MLAQDRDPTSDPITEGWYLGWCRVVPGPDSSSYLHVCGRLTGEPGEPGTRVEVLSGFPSADRNPQTVLWPSQPTSQESLALRPLAFRLQRTAEYGHDTPGVRWYCLRAKSDEERIIRPFGCRVLDTPGQDGLQIESKVQADGRIFTKDGDRLTGPWKNVGAGAGVIRLASWNRNPDCLLAWTVSDLDQKPFPMMIAGETIWLLPAEPPVEQAEGSPASTRLWKPLRDLVFQSPEFESVREALVQEEIKKRSLDLATEADKAKAALAEEANRQVEELASRKESLQREVAEVESYLSELADLAPVGHVRRRWPRLDQEGIDLKQWVGETLAGFLATAAPFTRYEDAEELAVACLGCRALLLPDAGYATAFCEACGGVAELLLVPVEPHWTRWQEAWTPEMAQFWKSAEQNPGSLYLLHFQDLDRSLPSLWGRPFWNLANGLTDCLPDARFRGWPSNLRLTASMAQDSASLPLENNLLKDFGALLPRTERSENESTRALPRRLPSNSWPTLPQVTSLHEETLPLGSSAQRASAEIEVLGALFRELGRRELEAELRACRIRISSPQRLASQNSSAAH